MRSSVVAVSLVLLLLQAPTSWANEEMDLDKSLLAALGQAQAAMEVKGAAATVILPDGSAWVGATGMADARNEVKPLLVFQIGDITNTFTAAAILQLVAEEKLSLDDPLAKFVGDYPNSENITIRQLLRQTSGLNDCFNNPEFVTALVSDPAREWTARDTWPYVGDPLFAPGVGWEYSATNYLLLGLVVEKTSGASIGDEFRRRFFKPLALIHTYYEPDEDVKADRAHGYLDINEDGTLEDITDLMPNTSFVTAAGAAGGIASSSHDIALWTRALVTGDILDDDGQKAMFNWANGTGGEEHGLGVLRTTLGDVELIGHSGMSAGYSGAAWHAPAENLTITVLTNHNGVPVTPIIEALLAATLRNLGDVDRTDAQN